MPPPGGLRREDYDGRLNRCEEMLDALERRWRPLIEDGARELDHHGWRLDALDAWRHEEDARMTVMESKVNDLRFTDAVASALADKLAAQQPPLLDQLQLTIWKKIGAGLFALALVVVPTVIAKVWP